MLKVGLVGLAARSLRRPFLNVQGGGQACSYFDKSELKLDIFEKISDDYRRKYIQKLEPCKRTVRRQVDGQAGGGQAIQVDDLNLLLYLAKNDDDVELIRKALIKFVQTHPDSIFKRFGSLYMRMLHFLNKPDKALEIYSSQELKNLFISDKYAILPLMDKLIDAKRYDDLYKLAIFYVDHFDAVKMPSTHLNCLTLAFYKKGTKEAYERIKSLLKRIQESDKELSMGVGSLVHVFLASIEQNDLEYSFEIMLKSKRIHQTLFRNMATIAFAKYDQIQEAFVYVESIPRLETSPNSANTLNEIMGYVFPAALHTLKEAISKKSSNNTDLLARYDALMELIKSRQRLFGQDIDEYFTRTYKGIYSSHIKQSNRLRSSSDKPSSSSAR